MAVVDTTTENKNDSSKQQLGKVIDPFSKNGLVSGEAKTLNLDNPDDAWKRSAPPKYGRYDLKLFAGKESYRLRYLDEKHPKPDEAYYTASLECRIVSDDPDVDNVIVFANVSTRLGRGKEISTMAALMVKNGKNPIPKGQTEATDLDVLQQFSKWIKSEPVVRGCLVDWKFSYQDETGKWRNVYNTYEDFPEGDDGEKLYEFPYTKGRGSREIGNATTFVREWGGKDSTSSSSNSNSTTTTTSKPEVKKHILSGAALAEDNDNGSNDDTEDVKPTAVNKAKGKTAPTVVELSDDDVADL